MTDYKHGDANIRQGTLYIVNEHGILVAVVDSSEMFTKVSIVEKLLTKYPTLKEEYEQEMLARRLKGDYN